MCFMSIFNEAIYDSLARIGWVWQYGIRYRQIHHGLAIDVNQHSY